MHRVSLSAASLALAFVVSAASPAEARPPAPQPSERWPEPLIATFDVAVGPMTWGHVEFEDPYEGLQMPGEVLQVERLVLWGGSVAVHYATEKVFTMGLRLTYGTNLMASEGAPRVAGLGATVEGVHVFSWAGELGLAHRFGDLTLYLVAHGAFSRAIVELSDPSAALRGRRAMLGPEAGLRAHVRGKLFLHAALFMDALTFPDHRVTFGLGVGQR